MGFSKGLPLSSFNAMNQLKLDMELFPRDMNRFQRDMKPFKQDMK
jgi:hypothetical protein